MAPEKSPAYQWYVKDFRSSRSTMRMSFAERGVYRDMLDQQWEDRTLPDDPHAVADLIATTDAQVAEVLAAWDVVRRKFVVLEDGRLQNARLERCRREWKAFQRMKRKGGQARVASADRDDAGRLQSSSSTPARHQQTTSTPPASIQPASASSSALASASAPADPSARSKRPIFTGQRLTVFDWMLDDLMRMLGVHTDTFDLHEWFFALDERAQRMNLVIPQRDGGAWLQAETLKEAQRRGLPIASSAAPLGKQTTRLAAAVANIHREAGQ